ncbi:crinkler (CRN) domain-containing protein [Thraustotheca clavata]|uniref:Crinkler (CRN) domain-containing protein n=1 Tax=Thraustotheca clavata TaxID=74557 RepID=A0A1V9YVD5_9STRA|nr:crinkler (CRN) domain-containing protein [Thraustotheca clavata]
MAREVWFQLVDGDGKEHSANFVDLRENASVARFRKAVFAVVSRALPANAIESDLTVFATSNSGKHKLEEDSPIGARGGSKKDALIVEVPQLQRGEASVSAEEQLEQLLSALEWREPKRLCASVGQDWPYQGASKLAAELTKPLAQHYNAWQHKNEDKQNHVIILVMSGPGTGKSRMLDEMKGLLCEAAVWSKNQALVKRMKSAYVFRVTFENGTAAVGSLLDGKNPEFDISYRMLYQLAKEKHEKEWPQFSWELKNTYSNLPLTIGKVIAILANLENVDSVKDMSVILCVDGLQKLVNDGTKSCDFYRVLTSICSFLNSSTAFAVCVCSATVQSPVDVALSESPQKRVFLVPAALCGDQVLKPRTRLEKQLVDDMGGHGRALETLQEALSHYTKEQLEEIDPASIVDEVCVALRLHYGDIFASAFFQAPLNCREVLAAILSRRRYDLFERVGHTDMTIDGLRSFGLFRWTREGYLECAFILLVMLMRKLPKKRGEVDSFDEHLTRSVLVWQRFEQFVSFYRRVKSIAYCQTPVELSTFHAGARFGSVNGVLIEELQPRTVVEAVHQHDSKSGVEDSTFFTNRDGGVNVSEMNTIVINGASASAGDIFMRVQLMIDDQQVQCNEVIQCKLLQTKQKINEAMYAKERTKAVNGDSDVFLLITPAQATEFALPPLCGIVSTNEFDQYFGPFASRAYRSFLEPPNINTASYHELRRIEGVGDATAEKIIDERKKRAFSSHADAVNRLFTNKKCKNAEILSAMHFDGVGADS